MPSVMSAVMAGSTESHDIVEGISQFDPRKRPPRLYMMGSRLTPSYRTATSYAAVLVTFPCSPRNTPPQRRVVKRWFSSCLSLDRSIARYRAIFRSPSADVVSDSVERHAAVRACTGKALAACRWLLAARTLGLAVAGMRAESRTLFSRLKTSPASEAIAGCHTTLRRPVATRLRACPSLLPPFRPVVSTWAEQFSAHRARLGFNRDVVVPPHLAKSITWNSGEH